MAFMRVEVEHMAMHHVETTCGTNLVPADLCDVTDVQEYCEGDVDGEVTTEMGWYGRLSAPGYLDCTSWLGPYATEREALAAVCDEWDVDAEGNDTTDAEPTHDAFGRPIDDR